MKPSDSLHSAVTSHSQLVQYGMAVQGKARKRPQASEVRRGGLRGRKKRLNRAGGAAERLRGAARGADTRWEGARR